MLTSDRLTLGVLSLSSNDHYFEILRHKRATPLALASRKRERMQAPSGPWAQAQRLRRPAAPTPLRARAVSAPAKGRDERCVIGLVAFEESHWVSM